jgi:UDP:flavonoid glycosyltransferase YjiC (YdhE family)
MTRVLYAWELGANYGHLARTVAVAESLRAEGCETIVAARDVELAHSLLTPNEIEFVGAPRYRGQSSRARNQVNYSDLLSECGYSESATLRALLRAWINLLKMIAPDALIVDHAPTALLAARGLGIPRVLIGTGFTVPPATDPMPPLRTGAGHADLATADARVLARINEALKSVAQPPLARVAELFGGTPALITSFRELDHYRDREHGTFVGPVLSPRQLPSVDWVGAGTKPRVFAYLNADFPRLIDALAALSASDTEVVCISPGIANDLVQRFVQDQLKIYDFPVDITALLPRANLVITHGGAGLTTQALMAGVPLLIIPRFVEQEMSARRVAELGAGVVVGAQRASGDFANALARVLEEPSFANAARSLAVTFASYSPRRAVDTIVQTVLQVAQPQPAAVSA